MDRYYLQRIIVICWTKKEKKTKCFALWRYREIKYMDINCHCIGSTHWTECIHDSGTDIDFLARVRSGELECCIISSSKGSFAVNEFVVFTIIFDDHSCIQKITNNKCSALRRLRIGQQNICKYLSAKVRSLA